MRNRLSKLPGHKSFTKYKNGNHESDVASYLSSQLETSH
jgi:hypothetical protein